MIMEVHDGPGVLPGRYAGSAIPIHSGSTPQQVALAEQQAAADALAGRICAAAAMATQSECQLLELIGEFDQIGAIRWWTDVKSLAHWLSWACAMAPGVAREHVRVAKALPRMPTVAEAFRQSRLSYSKVREITRVVDVVDESRLCELALTATASQLARMISGYRAADGSRIRQQPKRAVTWHNREDGMVDFTVRLPAEEAAVLIAAITAAKDQFGAPPAKPDPCEGDQKATDPAYSSADALLDVARVFLDTAPEDRSGEDRTLVVVHVSAENLGRRIGDGNVPAGTCDDAEDKVAGGTRHGGRDVPAGTCVDSDTNGSGRLRHDSDGGDVLAGSGGEVGDVPAGTFSAEEVADPTCHIDGVGPIETETARRLACDSSLLGAVVTKHGNVLALGRSRRLVSRALRRALMIRDSMCRFPGCHQTRHLQAHHRISWADGGATDLGNLILLCQWHHTAVHEGGMTIRHTASDEPGQRWEFVMPDGSPHRPWYTTEHLPTLLRQQLDRQREHDTAQLAAVTGFNHPDAQTIRPGWAGERFDLHECVQALFNMKLPEQDQQAA
jgi:hypothetical protein